MSYQPYLISQFATGLDRSVQPWILPDDAFVNLIDSFVYRGVLSKRDGYSGFANGTVYCESRMVKQVANAPMTGVIDSSNTTFTITATTPVRRGTFTVTGDTPAQSVTDNGLGIFTGDGTGNIDYDTGIVSVTFTTPPTGGTVTATYDYHQGLPVMGIMSFYPDDHTRELVVADTRFVNILDTSTNRLEDISGATPYSGNNHDFWSWVNYADASGVPRLLFCNGAPNDVIQQYDHVNATVVNYAPTFNSNMPLNALQMFEVRDRLVLFQTYENGIFYPRRIRISGTGADSDNFDNTATGAGFIDIPDNTYFYGASFNRDDIIFFTQSSTWLLKYTNNDVSPFILQKIDASRGSKAAFSVISYLNRTLAFSPRGLIVSNGYEVQRADDKIPDFSFDSVDISNFEGCFSGFLDEDRDVYLLYPSKGVFKPALVPTTGSDRILLINLEEDNFAVFRMPLSCVGNFEETEGITWNDLTEEAGFPNWNAMAAKYGDWYSFPFTEGSPVFIGGGHKGEIWRINASETQDNMQKIRDITIQDASTLRITTDWNNYELNDYIFVTGIQGTVEANNKQGQISQIVTPYKQFDLKFPGIFNFSAYTEGGEASRTIPMEALSKQLNPFINQNKKLKIGWLYMYVSVTQTTITEADGTPQVAKIILDVITNDNSQNTDPAFSYEIDCTNLEGYTGEKKWVKIWINQVAEFIQLRIRNHQAGTKIHVHAIMPGMAPVGRII